VLGFEHCVQMLEWLIQLSVMSYRGDKVVNPSVRPLALTSERDLLTIPDLSESEILVRPTW